MEEREEGRGGRGGEDFWKNYNPRLAEATHRTGMVKWSLAKKCTPTFHTGLMKASKLLLDRIMGILNVHININIISIIYAVFFCIFLKKPKSAGH